MPCFLSKFNAVAATKNQINFNIQVPSQETIIAREMYISAQLTLTIAAKALIVKNVIKGAK